MPAARPICEASVSPGQHHRIVTGLQRIVRTPWTGLRDRRACLARIDLRLPTANPR